MCFSTASSSLLETACRCYVNNILLPFAFLDPCGRADIGVLGSYHVVDRRKYYNASGDDNAPVHAGRVGVRCYGEKDEDECNRDVSESNAVDQVADWLRPLEI